MASKELRGASRRAFLQGAVAIGAAMGWGPAKLLEFIERGGGQAAADCTTKGIQNLVVFIGAGGAHGYPQLLFPHADSYTANGRFLNPSPPAGDFGCSLSQHFMQNTANGGTPNPAFGIASAIDFNGKTLAQRFTRMYGADNMAFGGYQSLDPTSQSLDNSFWGSNRIPSNTTLGSDKKFIVVSPHTPWVAKYGLKKAITSIDGGDMTPFHVNGANNHLVNVNKGWSVMAAAATIQLQRPSITPVIIVGGPVDKNGQPLYGSLPGAPVPAGVGGPTQMVDLFNSNELTGIQSCKDLIHLRG